MNGQVAHVVSLNAGDWRFSLLLAQDLPFALVCTCAVVYIYKKYGVVYWQQPHQSTMAQYPALVRTGKRCHRAVKGVMGFWCFVSPVVRSRSEDEKGRKKDGMNLAPIYHSSRYSVHAMYTHVDWLCSTRTHPASSARRVTCKEKRLDWLPSPIRPWPQHLCQQTAGQTWICRTCLGSHSPTNGTLCSYK